MKTIKLKLSELKAPERNVRIHTEKQIDEFIRSIKMFGQIRPVVVDENYVVLAGNGLVEALRTMGKDEVDVLVVGDLTDNQKKKLMIADNKIFSLGIENLETLNIFLEELQNDLDIPGFDEEILKTMVADGEEVTEKIAEYGTLDDKEIKAIREKREVEVVQSHSNGNGDSSHEEQTATPVTAYNDNEETEPTEMHKFVQCPKCGEKIWL